MNKIGIITLNGYVNYGNRLQNYALQEVLKAKGFEVETIWVVIRKRNPKDITLTEKIKTILKSGIKENYSRIQIKLEGKLYKNQLDKQRMNVFKGFSNKFIKETSYKLDLEQVPENINDNFDFFIVGSDQVWNPIFRKDNPLYFLQFGSKHKRLSYAPSFGTTYIPDEYIGKYSKWLDEMHMLSVREEAGAKIIKELTGKNAPVLVDPTLLLNKNDWLKIAKKPEVYPNKKYLLTYFLGNKDRQIKQIINDIAKRNNLTVINLAQAKDRESYLTGPSEFIYFINHASLFVTDSFHGAVFSILLETPFVITNRNSSYPSMNSRIETLLSMFNLTHRHINTINALNDNELFNIDLKHIPKILRVEREKSHTYLSKALKLDKEGN